MKKIGLLVIALMMVASVAFAQNITPGNLPDLKGTWVGILTFQVGVTCPAELVIQNDSVPVKATLTVSMIPETIAMQIGASGGVATARHTASSDDGKITTQGSLMFAGNKNFFEFFLKRDKLDGWFYYNGARGDVVLHKK
jgi:hypothetical protein